MLPDFIQVNVAIFAGESGYNKFMYVINKCLIS